MKKILLITLISLAFQTLTNAQNVGVGTLTPNSSAALDITSTNKGLLMPRMTTAQRTAIPVPAKGLLIFDTDANDYYFHNGSAWTSLSGGTITLPFTT